VLDAQKQRICAEERTAYRWFTALNTRWNDNDAFGHINNAVYYLYMDTAINWMLISENILNPLADQILGLVVESGFTFFEPLAFPQDLQVGVRVARLGRTSVMYEVGIFAETQPVASAAGHFTHVYVNRSSHRPEVLPMDIKSKLANYLQ
jgi:acyl-CoA thioester hydrolase